MHNHIKRIECNKSNDNLFFLNPYTSTKCNHGEIVFLNRIFSTNVRLSIHEQEQKDLIQMLINGVTEKDLIEELDKLGDGLDGKQLFRILLKGCVIA